MMDEKKTTRGNATGIARGFTLVEMVIVIGVIILLAALTLSVSVAVVEGSEVRQTENTIRLLTAAMQEWEAQADRRVTYGIENKPCPGDVYEIAQSDATDPDQMLEDARLATWELFRIIGRPTSVKQILAQVDLEAVAQEEDEDDPAIVWLKFFDAWGEPIVAVFPGRTWVQGPCNQDDQADYGDRDRDSTIRTFVEAACGGAANRQICFISAGPDGEFGNLSTNDPAELDLAEDNLYSYEPADPVSQ
ncbi:MAG: type II secretion system protein [Planctomycetota bacterium]|jgi:type II secretory pathway pseudopilin PulG